MKRVILDVDVGTDDAWAILIFLHAEKQGLVKIEAITCTAGNASIENVCKNVLRLLEAVNRTDIPIYKGSKTQLIRHDKSIVLFHGNDGFGDLQHKTTPDLSVIKNKPSSIAMNDIVSKYPKEVSLVCVAPLTNVALAVKLFDDFTNKVESVFIMGGNLTEVGNVMLKGVDGILPAEFNFYFDPEAADVVLNSFKCPIKLVPWETCVKCQYPLDWRFNVVGEMKNGGIELITRVERSVYPKTDKWLPCDAYLTVACLYPELTILKSNYYYASVELHGRKTRGSLVLETVDFKKANVMIIEEINPEFFKELVLQINV